MIAILCSHCRLISISRRRSKHSDQCAKCEKETTVVTGTGFDRLWSRVQRVALSPGATEEQWRDLFYRMGKARERFSERERVKARARARHANEPAHIARREARKELRKRWHREKSRRTASRKAGYHPLKAEIIDEAMREQRARDQRRVREIMLMRAAAKKRKRRRHRR